MTHTRSTIKVTARVSASLPFPNAGLVHAGGPPCSAQVADPADGPPGMASADDPTTKDPKSTKASPNKVTVHRAGFGPFFGCKALPDPNALAENMDLTPWNRPPGV